MTNDQTTPFPINLRPLNIIAHPHPPSTSRPFPDVVSSFFPNHPLPPSLQDLPAAATSPTTTRSTSTYASFFYPPTTVSTDSRFPGGLAHAHAQGFPNPSMPVWYPRAPPPPTTTNPLSSAIVAHTPAAAAASRIGGANISSDYDATPTTTTTTTTTTTPTTTAEESTDDSAKKVKFLCSFGGKILPRPSDGLLRYVGGHTRIISVKRDISFPDLVRKLMDAYGQPVIIKYQLPDEDLDALISVSCPEDLDNMMDEYTKLSSDGSAKLRLFLFSASDLQSSPHATHTHFADFHDSGQRYVDAVNGIPEVVGGVTLTRRGSTASATSTQNSDSLVSGSEGVDTSLVHALHGDGSGQPSSPGVLSPRVAPPTAVDATTRLVYVGPNPVMYAENPSVTMGHTTLIPPPTHTLTSALPEAEVQGPIRAVGQQKPLGYEYHQPSGMNFASTLAYTQAYVDPHQEAFSRVDYPQFSPQIGYPNSQTYGMPGSFYRHVDHPQPIQDNTAGFPPHQFIPTMHTTMASSTSNVNMRPNGAQSFMQQHQAWVNSYPEENSFGTRIVQLPNENIQKAHEFQPQSLQPPIQLQARAYDRFQVPSSEHMVFSDGCDSLQQKAFPERTIRLDDCHMCQKALPHAHSDTLVPDQRDSLTNTIANSNPAFHSLCSENISKVRAMRRIGVSGAMGEGTVEHQATKTQLIDGRMEAVYVNPSEISVNTEQCRLPSNQVRKEAILDSRSQMMGKETYLTNAISKPGVAPGEIHIKPVATLPSASSEVAYLQDLQPIESIRITQPVSLGNSGQYRHPDAAVQQLTSGEMWNSKLTFSGVDSAFATDTIFPTGGQRDEDPQYHSRIVSNDSVSVLPNGESALSPSSGFDEGDRDVAPSNSLFSNQDPWTLRHGTHFPPPRPNKVLTSKEAQLSGSLKKDVSLEQEGYIKDSAEEHIKQELQSVAEGVAASVLQSSVPSDVSGVEMSEPIPEDGVEVQNAAEDENVKTKLLDNTIPSLPISDGIGRLQIIKNNDLEELRELGSGTFGTVYHGKWRGTDVAIKRINNRCFAGKPSEQDRMRDDFWNEAIKLADLHHPNVVAFYGVVLDGPGGSVATVTEYMVNGSLRQAIQRNERTLDKRKRIVIAMDVAFGMEYLHGKNIVHFDLKSDNLLVNLRDPHRPICKVGDLGLSKVKCQTLISGGVRGTLPWMAPELLNGSSNLVSEKVDVFSFGIVMWELLTGEEPYADLHYGAIIGGIVSNTLRPTVPESCDSEWGSLMERCWSAEPSDRPNFTEIANQLRAMASSFPSKGQAQPSQPQPQR